MVRHGFITCQTQAWNFNESRLLSQLEAQFIFTGTSRHTEKDFRSYLQYLEYLNQNRPAPNAYELFAKGYEDYLQSPLQVSKCLFVFTYMKYFFDALKLKELFSPIF